MGIKITKDKETLAQYKQHYINLLSDIVQCGIAHFTLEENPTLLYANDVAYDIIGYTKEEVESEFGGKILNIIYEYDYDRLSQYIFDTIMFEAQSDFDIRIVCKGGQIKWVSCKLKKSIDSNGNIITVLSVIDITASVLYQKKIDEITENVPCAMAKIVFSKENINVLFANYLFYTMFPSNDSLKSTLFESSEFISKLYNPVFIDNISAPEKISIEYCDENQTKERKWIRLSGQMSVIDNKETGRNREIVYMCSFEDITSEKKAKDSQSELLGQLSGGMLCVAFDDKATCVSVNDTFREHFKLSDYRISGGFYSLFSESEQNQIKNYLITKISKGEAFEFSGHIWVDEKREYVVRVCGIYNGERKGNPYYHCYIFKCNDKSFFGRTFSSDSFENLKIDSLTGFYNRDFYKGKINRKLQHIFTFDDCWFAIIVIDNFIELNERFGYEAGDYALREISELIRRIFGNMAVVGRTGGVEFSLMIRDKNKKNMALSAYDFANEVQHICFGDNNNIKLTCKIGITALDEEDYYTNMYERAHMALFKLLSDEGKTFSNSFLFDDDADYEIDSIVEDDLFDMEDLEYVAKMSKDDVLYNASVLLEKNTDLNDSIENILSWIGKIFDVDKVSIVELHKNEQIYSFSYRWTNTDGILKRKIQNAYSAEELECLKIELKNKEFLLFEDSAKYPFSSSADVMEEYSSCCIIPIYESGELNSYIQCEKITDDCHFTINDIKKIKEVAQVITSYIVKAKADETEKAKNEFMSRMSHEIRTPINAINGMTDLLMANSIGDLNLEYVKMIKSSTNNLINMVDDILAISRLESGALEIMSENYKIEDIVKDLTVFVNRQLQKKNISFVVNVNKDLPKTLCGDEKRIRQILTKLLSNAIKFTQRGFIILNIDFAPAKSTDEIELIMSVKDSGIGIEKKDFDKLFGEFSQVDTSLNRSACGVGLGLSVARKTAHYMGGEILVESKPHAGSIFTFTVHQKIAEPSVLFDGVDLDFYKFLVYEKDKYYSQQLQDIFCDFDANVVFVENKNEFIELAKSSEFTHVLFDYSKVFYDLKFIIEKKPDVEYIAMIGKDVSYPQILEYENYKFVYKPLDLFDFRDIIYPKQKNKKENLQKFISNDLKVLIVDDNPVNLKVAQGIISSYQCKIMTALSGYEAIEILKNDNSYDMIFLDHMMPQMDGVETLHQIRERFGEYGKNLPAIALTANVIPKAQKLFRQSGFQGFLAKPIISKNLHILMEKFVPEEKKVMIDLSDSKEQIKTVSDEDIARVAMKGIDVETGLRCCGNDVNEYIEILKVVYLSGQQKAQELKQYAEEKNYEMYGIEAHALKSAAASIGAVKQSEIAREHEFAVKENRYHVIDNEYQMLVIAYQRMLYQIKNVLKREEKRGVVEEKKVLVEEYVWKREIKETVQAISNFEQKKAKELLEKILTYDLPNEVYNKVKNAQEKIKVYEDEEASKILEDIIKTVMIGDLSDE